MRRRTPAPGLLLRVLAPCFVIASLLVAGCRSRSGPEPSPVETAERVVGISFLTSENPFFGTIASQTARLLESNGFRVEIKDAENDPEKQERQMSSFIEARVAAIMVIPCNSHLIGRSIREANQASIPVFTCDVAAADPKAQVVSHIATDNYGGGKLAAHQILEAVDNRGDIAIIDYEGIESVQQRIRGFREVVSYENQEGTRVRIVAVLPASGSPEKARQAMHDILDEHPDVKAVFAVNDPTAFGAIEALRERGKVKQIRIVGFDGTREAKRLVREGIIYSDIVQFPEEIARHCADCIISFLSGDTAPAQILIPTSAYKIEEAVNDAELN